MELFSLSELKSKTKKKKRLGQGLGSGKGKTAGRGHKGQKARGKVPLGFEGGQLKLIKRLPFMRGIGNPSKREKPYVLNLNNLEKQFDSTIIDLSALKERKLLPKDSTRVKILKGAWPIKKALNLKGLSVSKSARKEILSAGGSTE